MGVAKETAQKKWKSHVRSYELTRRFQMIWSAIWTWAEPVLAGDGLLHQVRCLVCSDMDKKDCIMMPKQSTLEKHDVSMRHKQNLGLFAAKRPTSILEQNNNCSTAESKQKRVQLATLFQILSDGRLIFKFQSRAELYQFLQVPNCPHAHWSHTSGWILSEHIYSFVQKKMQ